MKILAIFFLVVLVISLIGVGYYVDYKNNNEITFGNIKISSTNLKTLADAVPEGNYVLCSLKEEDGDNPCVAMLKRELE